jgi:quercetin dioxygenase-like cupin family protein
MPDYFKSIETLAAFSRDTSTKTDLFASGQMFVGLNCFEPGQSQKTHVHAGSDKFYLVVSGKARIVVGSDTREVGAGTVVWAPSNIPHGVLDVMERTVMLVAMAPPPHRAHASAPSVT